MAEEYSLDEYASANRGFTTYEKKNFLEKWQDRPGHKCNIFLHTKATIAEVYRHGFFRTYDEKDKTTGAVTRRVYFTTLNCHETIENSRKQNKRDAVTGLRVNPPCFCPMDKLSEWCKAQVFSGALKWTDKLFEFKGIAKNGKEEVKTIRVGGMYNGFGGDKLTQAQKDDLTAAGLDPREAWKDNGVGKQSAVIRCIDADNLEKGVMIAVQPSSVGDAIRKVIRDTKESRGDIDGSPVRNPYCIQLDYHKEEPVFSKKYEARMIEKIKADEAVRKLIVDTEPPALDIVIEPFNATKIRPMMEKACLIAGVPWDEIFKDARASADDAPDENQSGEDHEAPEPPTPPPAYTPKASAPSPLTPPVPELLECDNYPASCANNAMLRTDAKCNTCGKVYIAEPAPPPPPVRAKRSAAVAAPAVAVVPPAAAQRQAGDDADQGTGDEIPF